MQDTESHEETAPAEAHAAADEVNAEIYVDTTRRRLTWRRRSRRRHPRQHSGPLPQGI